MAQLFEVEGKVFSFPDDATDDQIQSALKSQRAAGWWDTLKSIPQTAVGAFEKSVGGQLQRAGEMDAIGDYAAERTGDFSGTAQAQVHLTSERAKLAGISEEEQAKRDLKARTENVVSKTGAEIHALGEATVQEASPGQMDYWQRIVQGGLSNVPGQVPALLASVLARNPAPAMLTAGASAGGSTYGERRASGADIEQARAMGAVDASAEVLMEYLPTKFLLESGSKEVFKTILGYMAREGATEVATTAIQSANKRLYELETQGKPWSWKDYGQDLLDTFGSTMISAPILGGIAKGAQIARTPAGAGEAAPGRTLMDAAISNELERDIQPRGEMGTIIPNYSPQFDQPTVALSADAKAELSALIESIDAELIDDAAVEKAKQITQKHLEAQKADPAVAASWMGYDAVPEFLDEDASEIGASRKQAANESNYPNPNTGPRSQRKFLASTTEQEVAGLTMQSVQMQPGVYILGEETLDRPAKYMAAAMETVEDWRKKYMPNSTIVLSNERLATASALGSHYLIQPGQHLIVPAVLRNMKDPKAFNPNTEASAFYNLAHEFGHGLIKDRFLEGVAPEIASAIVRQSELGMVTEEMILALPAEQQAVVKEFNEIKRRIASNEMNALEFVQTWLSPGKLGRATKQGEQAPGLGFLSELGLKPTDNAMDVVKTLVGRASRKANIRDGSKAREMRERHLRDFLSLDEYLAEQTARHAYAAKWDEKSPLDRFFQNVVSSLRKFFLGLKADGIVKPGTAFTEWIEGLSKGDRPLTESKRVAEAKVKSGKRKEKAAAAPATKKKAPAKAKPKVEKVQHNVETSTAETKEGRARQLLTQLIRSGVFENAKDPGFKELMEYIKTEDWSEFIDGYKRYAGKAIKLQLDPDAEKGGFVGIKTDMKALVDLFGLNMYTGDLANILVKELVQNSFDAVKTRLIAGEIESSAIGVEINTEDRTITVFDEGVGMDKDTLLKALLTYPGTSKPDLPMEHRSGGLGQAKNVLLFAPEWVEVETSRNGKILRLTATGQQLLDGTARIIEEKGDPNISYTNFKAKIPKKIEHRGELKEVDIPIYHNSYSIIKNPPMFPGVKIAFALRAPGGYVRRLEIPSLLETHTLFKRVEAEWGYVDIYTGQTYDFEESLNAEHRVMSAGAFQFTLDIRIPGEQRQMLPMDLIFDVHAKVHGQHGAYPFTPERQSFKLTALKEMESAVSSIIQEYSRKLLVKHVEVYTKVSVLQADGSVTTPDFTVQESNDGVPLIEFTRGTEIPAFYYNPTNVEFLNIPGAGKFLAQLADVSRRYLQLFTQVHEPKGSLYSVGLGFARGEGVNGRYDNGWGGLHFKRPYHAIFVNPVYMTPQSPVEAASMFVHILKHESMHVNKQSHDAAAFFELATIDMKVDMHPAMAAIKQEARTIFERNWQIWQLMKETFDDPNTKTVGEQITGDESRFADEGSRTDLEQGTVSEERESGVSEPDGGSPWRNTSFELDISEHPHQRKWLDGLKNFVSDYPRLRRAVRSTTNAAFHVLELQQLAHLNPDVTELLYMNEQNGEYNRYKSRLQAEADAVLNEWNELGKENWDKLNKFLLTESEGTEIWYDLVKTQIIRNGRPRTWYEYAANVKTAEKAQAFGLDEELAALAIRIKNVLLSHVNEAEFALQDLLQKRHANASKEVLLSFMIPVARQIHEIRKQPFFPQGRFGNRMLIVEKKRDTGPGWETVWKEHFENPIEWEQAWKKAVAAADPATTRVRKKQLSDQTYVLMSLPLDFVDLAASELGLTNEQLDTLMDILQPVKRDKVLGVYEQQKLGIKGYSSDAMRSFANFTWHNSNMLAKLIYRSEFNSAIRGVGSKLREAEFENTPESLDAADRLQHIKTFMEKTRDYVMAPPYEAQMLRAAVSITYLGLNIKTALLNTWGMITTWSDLTSRLGQIEGNKLFLSTLKTTVRSIQPTNLNERQPGQYLSPEVQEALDRAIKDGVLSQSYAYHLAGMANAGNLYRLPSRQLAGRVMQQSIDAAMWTFRLTELATRRATFLAEFEAARREQADPLKSPYDIAVERTNLLQNDYSLGNRVPFMRGFKVGEQNPLGKFVEPVIPLMTVFMSFMQHMAFHAYGGYELGERRKASAPDGETPRQKFGAYTMKLWVLILLAAGYEGLPGAENLIDFLEIVWRKLGNHKPIRQELREMIQAVDGDPQLFARGLGHNVAGFDISRSLGVGRFVPGTDVLAHPRDNAAEQLGVLMLDLAGPTGGLLKFGLDAMYSNKGIGSAFEKLPGGIGNIYTAYRWTQHGATAPTGARVTFDLETKKLRDLTADEIIGKALGFNPTVVSQNREIRFNQYDRKIYWQTRRKMLMDDLWKARWQKDREAEADVKKAITEYNSKVPAELREMRLTGADIQRSMQARQKIKREEEKQSIGQRRYRGVYRDVRESYDRP